MMLVLNLKMNLSKDNIIDYERMIHDKDVIVLPQFPYMIFFLRGKYKLGSQDVSKFSKGSYTGEVCAKGLKKLGATYSLVGHSERKEHFNETLSDSKMKIKNLNDNDMIPIFCVNQTEEEYNNDKEYKGIEEQLEAIPEYTKYIVVAYEPIWMIGNESATLDIDHIENVLIKIKSYLMERNINHSIIYGGGISENNIAQLKNLKCNDGFIISTSALDKERLEYIYKETR